MKQIFSLLLLACLHGLAAAQAPAADSAWVVTHYTKQEVYIPMRDGVRLFTTIYAPNFGSGHPILMTRTPYSCNPYGPDFAKFWLTPKMDYARKGYVLVIQDVRGKFMSEGDFEDIRPYNPHKTGTQTDEASDTWDAIDWLVKNVKNNNGRVGVYGISYPGFFATMAALSGHPALKAVSPQAPVTEQFLGDDVHHNGAFMEWDVFHFISGFGKPRHGLVKMGQYGYQSTVGDNYKFYLDIGCVRNLTALTGDSIKFWNDVAAHPDYDDFWKARNTRSHVQHIPDNVATLVVGGLFDAEDCFGAWNLYKAIEQKAHNNNRLVIGPWSHGGWARGTGEYLGNIRFGGAHSTWYQQHIEEPFFDHYLLGAGDDNLAEATVFFTGANKWEKFNTWPPPSEAPVNLYLQAGGYLSWQTPPSGKDIYVKYTSDPAHPVPYADGVAIRRTTEYMDDDQRFAEHRPDVLTFKTDTLTRDVTLAGPLVADLFTALSSTDADFVVKLIDVFPDNFSYNDSVDGKGNGKDLPAGRQDYPMGGYEMLVRGEVMRGRYRNSFEKPEPFVPGKVTEVKYTMPNVAHVFKKGHRIMVQVQSSWFPLVDRNPQQFVDIYHCVESDFKPCDIKVYTSREYPSAIILPVMN